MIALSHNLAQRGLRPAAELAANRPHGDRLKYIGGCRCADCRRANTSYETMRAKARKTGDFNGIVSAEKARAHLHELSVAGIGRRSVSDVSDISQTIIQEIQSGHRQRIRGRTERAILAVTKDALADHALIPAGKTWKLLDELIASGYSKAELSRQLGRTSRALQLNKKLVTVRNAYEVELLYQRLRCCDSAKTLGFLESLREEGFTKRMIETSLSELAADLGAPVPSLQIKNRVPVRAAALIEKLHAQLMA